MISEGIPLEVALDYAGRGWPVFRAYRTAGNASGLSPSMVSMMPA
jgi:hypothetical protein